MANAAGNSSRLLIGTQHASAHTRSMAPSVSAVMLDNTSVLDEAYSFIPGLTDSSLTVETLFDDSATAGSWWETISGLFATEAGAPVSVAPGGFTVGSAVWLGSSVLSQLGIPSEYSGLVMMPITFTAKDQALWGHVLTPLQTITATTTGTAVDNGSLSLDGAIANLHLTAISGSPSLVVTIEDSANNSTWTTKGTFSTLSASAGAQRISIAGTIRRYVRAVCTITGGSSPVAICQVSLARL